MIAGRDAASHGEGKNSWLTGTAAWNYVAITQWILGIRPEHQGLLRLRCPAGFEQRPQDRLDAYTVETTADKLAAFEEKGLDVADSQTTATGVRAQMILTRGQARHVGVAGGCEPPQLC